SFEYFARRQRIVLLVLQTSCNQVGVTLALPNLRIVNAVHLVGQRQQRFRQELQLLHVYRELTGFSDEQITLNADEVAVVQQLKKRPTIDVATFSTVMHTGDVGFPYVDLKTGDAVREMNECRLAHHARWRCDAARETNYELV